MNKELMNFLIDYCINNILLCVKWVGSFIPSSMLILPMVVLHFKISYWVSPEHWQYIFFTSVIYASLLGWKFFIDVKAFDKLFKRN